MNQCLIKSIKKEKELMFLFDDQEYLEELARDHEIETVKIDCSLLTMILNYRISEN